MFRPARPPSLLTARSPATVFIISGKRSYAISIQPPKVWPGKPEARVFDERKTYLHNHFTSLLKRTSSQPVLFLHHRNFKANGLIKLRREVIGAALPTALGGGGVSGKVPSFSLLDVPPSAGTLPKVEVVRSSIFGVALRNYAPLDREAIESIAKLANGGALVIITLPSLDPPVLKGVLRALERSVPKKKKNEQAPPQQAGKKGKGKDDEDEGFVPGRRAKRQRPMLDPELIVAGALIEGRVFGVEQMKDVAKLPTLETLRAQIVGLISSPAVQLAMVLGEAGGGRLARTLDGLKKALEEGETGSSGKEVANVP